MNAPCIKAECVGPVGRWQLYANSNGLTHVMPAWAPSIALIAVNHRCYQQAQVCIDNASVQLAAYMAGDACTFTLALALSGTEFQLSVWQALLNVPYGKTCSYSDIALSIDYPKAVRAVGSAIAANPLAIIVPCHRVVGKKGQLTGYVYGVELKQQLLTLESSERDSSI